MRYLKKYFLLLSSFVLATDAYNQLNKHQFLTGGNGDFSYSQARDNYNGHNDKSKATNLNISADGGYFIMNRLCLGLRFLAAISNSRSNLTITGIQANYYGNGDTLYTVLQSKSISKSSGLGLSPFVRYYFLPNGGKLNIIGDISYSFEVSNVRSSSMAFSESYSSGGTLLQVPDPVLPPKGKGAHSNVLSVMVGPALFINPKNSFEILLGWKYFSMNHINTNSLSISFGFNTYLGK